MFHIIYGVFAFISIHTSGIRACLLPCVFIIFIAITLLLFYCSASLILLWYILCLHVWLCGTKSGVLLANVFFNIMMSSADIVQCCVDLFVARYAELQSHGSMWCGLCGELCGKYKQCKELNSKHLNTIYIE
jgi:hypothetical protein